MRGMTPRCPSTMLRNTNGAAPAFQNFATGGEHMARTTFLSVRYLLIATLALVGTGGAAAHPGSASNVVAKHDRTIPPDLEETTAATIGARTTRLNTCHLAVLDMLFHVADVIADAVRGE